MNHSLSVVNYRDYVKNDIEALTDQQSVILFAMIDQRARMEGAKTSKGHVNLAWLKDRLEDLLAETNKRIKLKTGTRPTVVRHERNELRQENDALRRLVKRVNPDVDVDAFLKLYRQGLV